MAKYLHTSDDFSNAGQNKARVELTATEARQGSWGRPVLYVLVGGLLLAMVAWAAVEMFGKSIEPDAAPGAPATTVMPDPVDATP